MARLLLQHSSQIRYSDEYKGQRSKFMNCFVKVCPCLASLRHRGKREKKSEDGLSLKEVEMIPESIKSEPPQSTDGTSQKVTFTEEPWFFGMMNRLEADALLRSPENKNGAYLIRCSDHDSAQYALSVKSSTRVKHFKVHQDKDNSFYIEPSQHFTSITALVEQYCNYSLAGTDRLGLPCKRPETSEPSVAMLVLPKNLFTLEEELGSGYFADVYRGKWRNKIIVAIKIIKDHKITHRDFNREIQTLKTLRHRHLISLFAVCTESPPYYIVTELMEKGSLLQFLRGPEGQHQDIVSLVDMGAQVADGMAYLEEKKCIHRDLAARNVLMGEDYICKVSDFGLSHIMKNPYENTGDSDNPTFSCKWSAPETISHLNFSNKSDVWSFGVLLYEIITFGGIPYADFIDQDVYEQVITGYRMPCPSKCPMFLYDIMKECWSAEPSHRPTFSDLMRTLDTVSYEWTVENSAMNSTL